MPRPSVDGVVVVVPAHDEQRLIPAALDALRVAAARIAPDVQTSLVVVANGCTDRTAELAAAGGATVVELDRRNVGAARAAGFAHALAVAGDRTDRLWLTTTDADSRVAPGWLAAQVAAAGRRSDLYLGTVTLEPHERTRFATWLAGYAAAYETPERHGHVHGASMGMRATAYRRVGGFRALERSEDLDLVSRLVAAGARVTWDATCPVTTSARLAARAPAGVAHDLGLSLEQLDEAV